MSLQIIEDSLHHFSTLSKKESKIENEVNPINLLIRSYQRQKKDFRIIIGGDNGNGKSALAQRIGEEKNPKTFIDSPEFAVKHQINFKSQSWINGVNYLKPFAVNIYDEPLQSGGNHREFMTEANMVITKTVGTGRFKKLIIPLCIPFIDMLDKDLRKLCQIYVYCHEQGKAEVFEIKNPKFGGDPYYPKIIDSLTWVMPNPTLWKLYEAKKAEVQGDIYKKYQLRLNDKEQSERTNQEIYQELTVIADTSRMDSGRIHIPSIMERLGVGRNRAEALRAKYERNNPDN